MQTAAPAASWPRLARDSAPRSDAQGVVAAACDSLTTLLGLSLAVSFALSLSSRGDPCSALYLIGLHGAHVQSLGEIRLLWALLLLALPADALWFVAYRSPGTVALMGGLMGVLVKVVVTMAALRVEHAFCRRDDSLARHVERMALGEPGRGERALSGARGGVGDKAGGVGPSCSSRSKCTPVEEWAGDEDAVETRPRARSSMDLGQRMSSMI